LRIELTVTINHTTFVVKLSNFTNFNTVTKIRLILMFVADNNFKRLIVNFEEIII